MTESRIQKQIVDFLDSNGYWWDRSNSGSAFVGSGKAKKRIWLMRAGCPDLLACKNGDFIGIEVKKDEKEYNRWKNVISRYKKAVDNKVDLAISWKNELLTNDKIKKSWEREVGQYKYAIRMHRGGASYILTYSVNHLGGELEKIHKK